MTQQMNDVQSTLDAARATAANDPALQAALDAISNKYSALIADTQNKNKILLGNANTSMAAFGGLGPMSQSFLSDQVTAADKRVSALQTEEDNLKLQTQIAYQTKNAKAVSDLQTEYDKLNVDKMNSIKDLLAAVTKQQQDTAKVQYDTITKPIQDIAAQAAKNGASSDIIAKIGSATTVSQAIQLAGSSIQTSTSPDIASYLFYKQQATNSGIEPQPFDQWKQAHDAATAATKQAEAFATAKGTAMGKAAGEAGSTPPPPTEPPVGLGSDSKGGSILQQTGLSIGAYNYLTQGTASMSRMPVAQRTQIMNEAQAWLNKNGVDISTFQSQYKAYNEVVQNNIARANNTTIAAQEVSGTADQFIADLGNDITSLKPTNVATLFATGQVNDPTTQKYAFDLHTMQNDLASYFAASRSVGAGGTVPTPTETDKADAAAVIVNGLNKGGAQAFKQSINANEAKVTNVVNTAVTSAQKQVWNLFGVGEKFSPGKNSTSDSLLLQQQGDPANISTFLGSQVTNPNDPAGLF
ncbi:hypothetical protein JJE66_33730 [Bradyrhizobium diazoefficiens]|uniref:hypothetical protein n=1 Tax=Bradyrhizobium diazoefficiens TaxID=1355477 RepID=UPI00190D4699|nr:hypothetical protein [Bradyrhizobium diazoefficiens]MBK3666169.1 hypothetical protein [Bradyrhizobium diazoefficiens]